MAILPKDINPIEVRIRRYPESTYFEEYVKVGDREKADATSCTRYIIPEMSQKYTVEVKLKKGYNFGVAKCVSVCLFLPGISHPISTKKIYLPKDYEEYTEDDIITQLEYVENVRCGRTLVSGARLVFHQVIVGMYVRSIQQRMLTPPLFDTDEELQNETNVMGVIPTDLGSLRVVVRKEKYDLTPLTATERAKSLEESRREVCF